MGPELPFLVLGLLFFEGVYILLYGGTPTFWQRGLWDSCFQNPSESSANYKLLFLILSQKKNMLLFILIPYSEILMTETCLWERSGSVVECLTRDRRAAGSSLTRVTGLWPLSKTHLS